MNIENISLSPVQVLEQNQERAKPESNAVAYADLLSTLTKQAEEVVGASKEQEKSIGEYRPSVDDMKIPLPIDQGGIVTVLPPLYQHKREIEAILNSEEFAHKIPEGENLREIRKIDDGYLVITDHYLLVVTVKYEEQPYKQVGPAKFSLIFGDPIKDSDTVPRSVVMDNFYNSLKQLSTSS